VKALVRVVLEGRQLLQQDGKDILREVIDLRAARPESAGPVAQQRRVEVDEALPRRLRVRVTQALEQADRSSLHQVRSVSNRAAANRIGSIGGEQ
jgi:hypothetical protein